MASKPVIFISATSDLRWARDLVGKVLYSMGNEPVWQEIAATDGGELLDVLRARLAPCSMVLQLVGARYGAEPPRPTVEFGRVSYTQFEALEAERLGKKVIYHVLDERFPTDPAQPESPELTSLQSAYRLRLIDTNRLRYDSISNAGDLELSIHRISDKLAELRKESDARHRKLLRLSTAAVVGVAAVAILLAVALRWQQISNVFVHKEITGVKDQIADVNETLQAYSQQLSVLAEPKPSAQGQFQPATFSPEVIEKAKYLADFGDNEQRALGFIFLKRHEEADQVIQQLKSAQSNPIDDSFRLLTMEGNNWYQAGLPDKAIDPFEKALALKPNDVSTRLSLVSIYPATNLGNVVKNSRRAFEIAEDTLPLTVPGSEDRAKTQLGRGGALLYLPADNGKNVKKAIADFVDASTFYTKDAYPQEWAATQFLLGVAWFIEPTGNKTENLQRAFTAYESALTVWSKDDYPALWALVQSQCALACIGIPTGDKAENLKKSIADFADASTLDTKDAGPALWAMTQFNFGLAWQNLRTGNKEENLNKALAAYKAALTVYTKQAYPAKWAFVQFCIGRALQELSTGSKDENMKNAIAAYESALTVHTKDAYPAEWATTQSSIGNAWQNFDVGDRGENLKKAIAAYDAALIFYTKEAYPADWALTQINLGTAWRERTSGDKSANLKNAIAAFEAALTVYTKEAYPADWAWTQNNIGLAWRYLPTGDASENLKKALAAYESALTVYTKEAYPTDWAVMQNNIGIAWGNLPAGDRSENLHKEMAAYESALTVYTKEAYPADWAKMQKNIGLVWRSLPTGDASENLKKALAAYESALTVYTKEAYPVDWAWTKNLLGHAWQNLGNTDLAIANYDEVNRFDPKNVRAHFNRSVARLLLHQPSAANGFQDAIDIEDWKGEWTPYAVILGHLSARFDKNDDRAKRFLNEGDGMLNQAWPNPAIQYLRGNIDEKALLALATNNGQQTEARCYLGMDHLLHQRTDQARSHFQWVQEHGTRSLDEYMIAVSELKRLENQAATSQP